MDSISKILSRCFLVLFLLQAHLTRGAPQNEFLETHFPAVFSKKLSLERDPAQQTYRLIVKEAFDAEEQIFKLPDTHIIRSNDPFPYSSEIESIIFEMKMEDNISETLHFLLRLLLGRLSAEAADFKHEYLNSLPIEKDTILWWNKEKMQFFKNETYFYNQIWIQNMVDETELIIKTAGEILERLQQKFKDTRLAEVKEGNEIRAMLEFLHKNIVFLPSNKWMGDSGKPQPAIIPFFNLVRRGKTTRDFNITERCAVSVKEGFMYSFLFFESSDLIHASDCKFLPKEEYFMIPRGGSSFENFLTYGEINENEEYDILDMYLDDRMTRPERELMIKIGVISKQSIFPSFYFDNRRLNKNFRNYGIVKATRARRETIDASFFKQIHFYKEDFEILLEAFSRYHNFFTQLTLDKNTSQLADYMAKELFNIKRANREEKFQKNIKILRFYQRKVIDAQINLSRRRLIRLMREKMLGLKEETFRAKNKI